MKTKPAYHTRLRLLLERINKIHARRRLAGRRVDYLYPRSKRITAAYLIASDAARAASEKWLATARPALGLRYTR